MLADSSNTMRPELSRTSRPTLAAMFVVLIGAVMVGWLGEGILIGVGIKFLIVLDVCKDS